MSHRRQQPGPAEVEPVGVTYVIGFAFALRASRQAPATATTAFFVI